jgi:hypothetical protein
VLVFERLYALPKASSPRCAAGSLPPGDAAKPWRRRVAGILQPAGRMLTDPILACTSLRRSSHQTRCPPGPGVLQGSPAFQHGCVEDQATLPPGGLEVFGLRKLLPQTADYDFNVHVMDFKPGEYLHIKVGCVDPSPGHAGGRAGPSGPRAAQRARASAAPAGGCA